MLQNKLFHFLDLLQLLYMIYFSKKKLTFLTYVRATGKYYHEQI